MGLALSKNNHSCTFSAFTSYRTIASFRTPGIHLLTVATACCLACTTEIIVAAANGGKFIEAKCDNHVWDPFLALGGEIFDLLFPPRKLQDVQLKIMEWLIQYRGV